MVHKNRDPEKSEKNQEKSEEKSGQLLLFPSSLRNCLPSCEGFMTSR